MTFGSEKVEERNAAKRRKWRDYLRGNSSIPHRKRVRLKFVKGKKRLRPLHRCSRWVEKGRKMFVIRKRGRFPMVFKKKMTRSPGKKSSRNDWSKMFVGKILQQGGRGSPLFSRELTSARDGGELRKKKEEWVSKKKSYRFTWGGLLSDAMQTSPGGGLSS